MTLSIGAMLGAYEVTAKLGEGGMGEVYRATDTSSRDVAIKVLPAVSPKTRSASPIRARSAAPRPRSTIRTSPRSSGSRSRKAPAPWSWSWSRARRWQSAWSRVTLPFSESLSHLLCRSRQALEGGARKGDRPPRPEASKHQGSTKGKSRSSTSGWRRRWIRVGCASSFADRRSPTADAHRARRRGDDPRHRGVHGAGAGEGCRSTSAPTSGRSVSCSTRCSWAGRLFAGHTSVTRLREECSTREPDWQQVPARARRLLRKCLERDPQQRLRDIGDASMLLDEPAPTLAPPRKLRWSLPRR